jgi:flagellar basal-body rod protein FlgB
MSDPVTKALLMKALDAAALRHQAIASNIANAGSVDYRPLKVNFEQQLGFARAALSRGGPSQLTAADVAGLKPVLEQGAPRTAGTTASPAVMLDMEMVKLSQNTLQYQALLKGLSGRGSLLGIAVNEGRR